MDLLAVTLFDHMHPYADERVNSPQKHERKSSVHLIKRAYSVKNADIIKTRSQVQTSRPSSELAHMQTKIRDS